MKNLVLVAGSINMDLVLEVEDLPRKGETIHAKTFRYVPGGKGANQAVAASRLGGDVALVGKIGKDDFGRQLRSFLKKEKLNLTALGESAIVSGTAFITVGRTGGNTIVVFKGANWELSTADIEKQETLIKTAKVVVSNFEINPVTVEKIFSIAKKHKVITVLNPSPAVSLSDKLLRLIDIFVLNETELSFYSGAKKKVEKEKEIVLATRKLQAKGVGIVVATLGSKGAITVTKDKIVRTTGLKVNAVDTTAAGDCFVGALAVQLANEVSLEETLDFANRAAALSVQRYGASSSLPYLRELGN